MLTQGATEGGLGNPNKKTKSKPEHSDYYGAAGYVHQLSANAV